MIWILMEMMMMLTMWRSLRVMNLIRRPAESHCILAISLFECENLICFFFFASYIYFWFYALKSVFSTVTSNWCYLRLSYSNFSFLMRHTEIYLMRPLIRQYAAFTLKKVTPGVGHILLSWLERIKKPSVQPETTTKVKSQPL